MKEPSCTSWCTCNHIFCAALLFLLCFGLLADAMALFGGLATSVTVIGSPFSGLAAAVAVGGLYLGYRHHGSAQPLFIALFGFLWVVVGYVVSPFVALAGGVIVLGAALMGAMMSRARS